MSLNFRLPEPIERFYVKTEGGESILRGDVESCILSTMGTGIGQLKTEADAIEHYTRAAFLARVTSFGHSCIDAFSLPVALSLVGLHTNVSKETESSWLRRIGPSVLHEIRYGAKEKAAKAKTTAA